MRSLSEIQNLLSDLDNAVADELEDQDLDFKEWEASWSDAIKHAVKMAVCMANAGGGTVVFGVADSVIGRGNALKGVPPELDTNRLMREIYNQTDPKITPLFEFLNVPEGTGRLLIMHIHPGIPPYTNTAGQGWRRVGKDCQPLTGSQRSQVMVETGETDFTAKLIDNEDWKTLISASAVEKLREVAKKQKAPEELLQQSDTELFNSIGILKNSKMTLAGLLLVGSPESIEQYIPRYVWTFERMKDETDYIDRLDGREAWPIAMERILDRIHATNTIVTIPQGGMFHLEYRTYPEIALREALMNAFCHADFRLASPILIKQFPEKIQISNPGDFIGGVSPTNILHHQPVARNPYLVDVLIKLRLANRSHLGVPRIYRTLLMEGKEPPIYSSLGDGVMVILIASLFSPEFQRFVEQESKSGRELSVDQMLIIQRLIRFPEVDVETAVEITQAKSRAGVLEVLASMEQCGYLERSGNGHSLLYHISSGLQVRLQIEWPASSRYADRDELKQLVLKELGEKTAYGRGLSSSEIRRLTHLDRNQVYRLMNELVQEYPKIVRVPPRGRQSKYYWDTPQ